LDNPLFFHDQARLGAFENSGFSKMAIFKFLFINNLKIDIFKNRVLGQVPRN